MLFSGLVGLLKLSRCATARWHTMHSNALRASKTLFGFSPAATNRKKKNNRLKPLSITEPEWKSVLASNGGGTNKENDKIAFLLVC